MEGMFDCELSAIVNGPSTATFVTPSNNINKQMIMSDDHDYSTTSDLGVRNRIHDNHHILQPSAAINVQTQHNIIFGSPTTDDDEHSNDFEINRNQPMNENNMRHLLLLQNSIKSKQPAEDAPLSRKNWPLFSIPCFGKLPYSSKCWTSNSHQRDRDRVVKEKRYYKMPLRGHYSDPWSWTQYTHKLVYATKRIYYKCGTRNDCKAIRRVEQKGESVIMKYTHHHNHPPPPMNTTSSSQHGNNNRRRIIKDQDCIFQGLGNLIDL